jgi:hypothetical protein
MTAVTIDPRESIAEVANPLGLDGIELLEYATARRRGVGCWAEGSQCAPNAPLTPLDRP